jgi:hypothetical protein
MQHRIIVVDTRPGVPVAEAQRHWRERHAAVYLPTPMLAGYVQNRPLEEEWERLGSRSICSETWFADHDAEKASFASDYYRGTVMPDERRFLDRESAWMGRFLADARLPSAPPRFRVLAFGVTLPGAEGIAVDRHPSSIASVWLDDRVAALELARSVDGYAFAAEPALLRVPPAP